MLLAANKGVPEDFFAFASLRGASLGLRPARDFRSKIASPASLTTFSFLDVDASKARADHSSEE